MHAVSALSGLPELAEVRKVWFSDWYDGPITGVAVHDGREYWFVMVTNDAAGGTWDFEPRVYILHRLSRDQLMQAWAMHRAFASAGLPGCLHSPSCDAAGGSAEDLDALRERWPPEVEAGFMNAPAIGWYRDG
ncbi:hypothetical protein [Dactylosporangium matsuzakiense]|uniref:Uncharacterized protein n=1 Tax=Dactylosporangium matsuzakiense TaxID=53360 RepID=A0A9W6NK51_9ACTN|nr:hypothetical protein [Dactylosporangium matsuzakiense]GLK99366.1 hypothetical protein GCM10017581_011070 [Dactylosporangium matsuzakiense]